MHVKTILNRIHRHGSFVYEQVRFVEEGGELALEAEIRPRVNGRAKCSGCGAPRPGYDTLKPRRFEFIPIWGMAVYFVYAMRRVDCADCGIVVESVPWGSGKQKATTTYAWFLANWAKRLSWSEVAEVFHTSWGRVFRSVEMAVTWGLQHRDLEGVEAIGVDEVLWHRGYGFLTVVYQIDEGVRRLFWVGENRTMTTLLEFFRFFGPEYSARLRFICTDMWKPYLNVIALKASEAIHVLDRFHIMAHMNKAITQVRAQEAKRLKANGYEPHLKGMRYCLLKRPENLTESQEVKLAELLRYNPEVGPGVPPEGRLPGLLGVRVPGLGRQIPRPLVHTYHALEDRTHETRRPDVTQSPRAPAQLVPCSWHCIRWRYRGSEQQIETHPQKSVRLSDLPSRRSRPLPYTWRSPSAHPYPQILVKNRKEKPPHDRPTPTHGD